MEEIDRFAAIEKKTLSSIEHLPMPSRTGTCSWTQTHHLRQHICGMKHDHQFKPVRTGKEQRGDAKARSYPGAKRT
jgi:hypothetical protein